LSARAVHDAAIVLRSTAYAEADRVVTLLTRDHGLLSAIAKGARNSKRRFAGSLEGFAWISVELSFGSGALSRLGAARVTRSFPRLLGELPRLDAAGALMRSARQLIPERAPDLAVFDALSQLLVLLDRPELPADALEVAGQAQLLALTGFAPQLTCCASCGKVPGPAQAALFEPTRGGIMCRACGGGSQRVAPVVRARLQTALEGAVEQVASEPWNVLELQEAKQLLSRFLDCQLSRL